MTATWNASVFVVKAVQAVFSSCFNANSNSAGDLHTSEGSWQASIARHAMQALQASFQNWNQTTLVPSLISQLRQSASSLASTQQVQQQVDAPNGVLPDILNDLSALELEASDSSGSGQSGSGLKGKGSPSATGLVPFSDFDNALAGADQTLESALQELSQPQDTSLESDAHDLSVSPVKATQAGMADISLVPFSDFDDALGGADESLEAADDDDEALEAEITSNSLNSRHSGSSAAVATAAASSPQVQRLSEAMTQYVLSVGAVTAAEQQAAAVATARAESSLESGGSQGQLAALEWEHEEVLSEALQLQGGLGQPVVILPKVSLCLSVCVDVWSRSFSTKRAVTSSLNTSWQQAFFCTSLVAVSAIACFVTSLLVLCCRSSNSQPFQSLHLTAQVGATCVSIPIQTEAGIHQTNMSAYHMMTASSVTISRTIGNASQSLPAGKSLPAACAGPCSSAQLVSLHPVSLSA